LTNGEQPTDRDDRSSELLAVRQAKSAEQSRFRLARFSIARKTALNKCSSTILDENYRSTA